jgi:hypothetical protein
VAAAALVDITAVAVLVDTTAVVVEEVPTVVAAEEDRTAVVDITKFRSDLTLGPLRFVQGGPFSFPLRYTFRNPVALPTTLFPALCYT